MSNSRAAPLFQVYLNGQLADGLRVLRVEESVNGSRLDFAEIELDWNQGFADVHDFTLPTGDDYIEIFRVIGATPVPVHFGKPTVVQPLLGPGGSGMRLISRIEQFHFGRPFDGAFEWNPTKKTATETGLDLRINPEIDGRMEGNRHPNKKETLGDYYYVLDPESTRTAASRTLQGVDDVPEVWTLTELIVYLCGSLNGSENNIRNPTRDELALVIDDNATPIRDFAIRFGDYLPTILDSLLTPRGYRWCVDKLGLGDRKIRIIRRNHGNVVHFPHQRSGANFDETLTQTESSGVRFDKSKLANSVTVRGHFCQVEFTAELQRAWPTHQDSLTSDELLWSEILDWDNALSDLRPVWRKWVLNEAGDYNDLRSDITEAFDMKPLFGDTLDMPRRRRLLPTLTLGKDGAPIGQVRGVFVEISDPNSEGAWIPLQASGCQLLRREAGIMFTGERIPNELRMQGEDAKLRVTATLQADFRVQGVAPRRATSPQADEAALIVVNDRQFQWRTVGATSQFQSDVQAKTRKSLERDDRAAIQAYAEDLREQFDVAAVNGQVTLEGTDHTNYKLGDLVTGISGRNISFSGSPLAGGLQFPQIAAIGYDVQRQRTTIALERPRRAIRV